MRANGGAGISSSRYANGHRSILFPGMQPLPGVPLSVSLSFAGANFLSPERVILVPAKEAQRSVIMCHLGAALSVFTARSDSFMHNSACVCVCVWWLVAWREKYIEQIKVLDRGFAPLSLPLHVPYCRDRVPCPLQTPFKRSSRKLSKAAV